MVSLPIVVFILLPLSILVKIFQAIQSPGPLFYRQTRSGLGKLPFRIFTFRTTRISKDDCFTAGDTRPPAGLSHGAALLKTSLIKCRSF